MGTSGVVHLQRTSSAWFWCRDWHQRAFSIKGSRWSVEGDIWGITIIGNHNDWIHDCVRYPGRRQTVFDAAEKGEGRQVTVGSGMVKATTLFDTGLAAKLAADDSPYSSY